MTHPEEQNDTLPQIDEEVMEMATVQCPKCIEHNRTSNDESVPTSFIVACYRDIKLPGYHSNAVMFEGIITCLIDRHRRPIKIIDNIISETAPEMPITESTRLSGVPADIVQDVKEAETCYFNQTYKASVVVCRRALQLAFEHLYER